ncbi:NmrA family NAD(P)-binding protein [Streptomyces sp. NPDC006879]|uniref:NmrA family NAD(P)-binding protein n=1 Tax=Streptomyces sp. NPDC006879 TaxID=3364767 RepID=UPI0036A039E1
MTQSRALQDGTDAGTTVLVTAATGKTGRRVRERLASRGYEVRAGSRSGSTHFDWEDEGTWGPALDGVDSAYVAYYPDLAAPGAKEAMRAFGRAAVDHGVQKLVLLSGRGEPLAHAAEEALRSSGVQLTVVRAAFFAENFTEGLFAAGVSEGELPMPAGTTAEPFVCVDDVAAVVVHALTEDGQAGLIHELSGPRALTFEEALAQISTAIGRPVRYTPVSASEYSTVLRQFGLSTPEANFVSELFAELLDGRNSSPTDGVRQVLGRAPRDFAEYVKEAAAKGAWSPH